MIEFSIKGPVASQSRRCESHTLNEGLAVEVIFRTHTW